MSSDIDIFRHVFHLREYEEADRLEGVDTIVDCGANVGFSAVYFLNRFPRARVIAIEPDPDNFAQLRKNTAAYVGRIVLVNSGVWSESCGLVMNEEPYRCGRECSRRVRPVAAGERPQMIAVSLSDVIQKYGIERVGLLKVDVEGAETEIFGAGDLSWLGKVENIAIELHDAEARETFMSAVKDRAFTFNECGDMTICCAQRGSR